MGVEDENRSGEEGRRADRAASSGAKRKSGEDQPALRHADDTDPSRATSREQSSSAMRRRAERRQSSVLIALWGDVERRSGNDQRASPRGNDIDHDEGNDD
jgi:hypothetical protein